MSRAPDLARRSIFRGQYTASSAMLLPPWSVNDVQFLDLCTRCGDCVSACPENILIPGSGGFPTTSFTHRECTFCEACVSACDTGALRKDSESAAPWQQAPIVTNDCLARKGVVCRSCSDACEPEAIGFEWGQSPNGSRGVATPSINSDQCNGCGGCISTCPSDALVMQALPLNNSTENAIEAG